MTRIQHGVNQRYKRREPHPFFADRSGQLCDQSIENPDFGGANGCHLPKKHPSHELAAEDGRRFAEKDARRSA